MATVKYKDKDGNFISVGAGLHTHSPSSIGAADREHPHDVATSTNDGFLSSTDKEKIDNISDVVFGNEAEELPGLVDLVGETPVGELIASAIADKVDTSALDDYATKEELTDGTTVVAKATNADTAATLSESLPIKKGGTGATSAPAALVNLGLTALAAELNYCDGVTSNIQDQLDNKVGTVPGKGLSTNDYTTAEKNKLAGIDPGANKTVVDSALSSTSTNPVQNKVVYDIDAKIGGKPVSEQISEHNSVIVTKSSPGHMSAADKTKLDYMFDVIQIHPTSVTAVIETLTADGSGKLNQPLTITCSDDVVLTVEKSTKTINIGSKYVLNVVRNPDYVPDSNVADNVVTIVLPN